MLSGYPLSSDRCPNNCRLEGGETKRTTHAAILDPLYQKGTFLKINTSWSFIFREALIYKVLCSNVERPDICHFIEGHYCLSILLHVRQGYNKFDTIFIE